MSFRSSRARVIWGGCIRTASMPAATTAIWVVKALLLPHPTWPRSLARPTPSSPHGGEVKLVRCGDRDLELVDRLEVGRAFELEQFVRHDFQGAGKRTARRLRHQHLGRAHLGEVGAVVHGHPDERE